MSKALLQAIENSGVRRSQIARETGIEQAVLSRFVNGKRGLTLDTIDKLALYFKLELRRVDEPATKKGKVAR